MKRIALIVGTRPEAIKMAPVFRQLADHDGLEPLMLLTKQHEEQLHQALSIFDIPIEMELDLMETEQTLYDLAGRMIPAVAEGLQDLNVDFVLVHGDTLTTFAGAWTAFMEDLEVGHIEAGLRSHDMQEPFPEEAMRRLTDVVSKLALAPTSQAKANLVAETTDPEQIVVTGQTGIDAIQFASEQGTLPEGLPDGPYVTVTMHRRENWDILKDLAVRLADFAEDHPEYTFVYPVHLNPVVQRAVRPPLESVDNFVLLDPLEYGSMAALLGESAAIITDSGGLQEEGVALDVPVFVLRDVTERPEGVETGAIEIVGHDPESMYEKLVAAFDDDSTLKRMREAPNPYGDGQAAARCGDAIAWKLRLRERPPDWEPDGT
jgi:UDP-N-acetylglucosamine 2-epimerase (non-hydrolysing)